jgi:hypothetical protein
MRALPPIALLLVVGCKMPDPAPTELDELVHFFFSQTDDQEHERILEGADNLVAWYQSNAGSEDAVTGGVISDLSQAQIDALEELEWEPDPSLCAGVFVVSQLSCDLDSAAAISLEPNQTEVFEGNYQSYDRTWDSDPDCYVDGSCDGVDWTSIIEDNFVGNLGEMFYTMVVKMRRSRDEDGVPSALLIRSVMPDVAEEDVGFGGFEQSYHLEAYVPNGAGLIHLYGMWSYGWAFESEHDDKMWFDQYLAGLEDFEVQLEDLCVNGWDVD